MRRGKLLRIFSFCVLISFLFSTISLDFSQNGLGLELGSNAYAGIAETAVNLLGSDGDFEVDSNSDGLADGWTPSTGSRYALDSWWKRSGDKSQKIVGATYNGSPLRRSITNIKNSNTYLLVLNSKVTKTAGNASGAYSLYGYVENSTWAGGPVKSLSIAEGEKRIVHKFTTSASATASYPTIYLGYLSSVTDEVLDIYMDSAALYDLTALGLQNKTEDELASIFNFGASQPPRDSITSLLGSDGDFEADTDNDGVADGWIKGSNHKHVLDSSWKKSGYKSQKVEGVISNGVPLQKSISIKNSNTYLLVLHSKLTKTSGNASGAYAMYGYVENSLWAGGSVKSLSISEGEKKIVHKFTTSTTAIDKSPMIYLGFISSRTDEVLDIYMDGVALYDLTALGLQNKNEDELASIFNFDTNQSLGESITNLLGSDGNFEIDSNSNGVGDGWTSNYNGTNGIDSTWKIFGAKSQKISGVTNNTGHLAKSLAVKNYNTYLVVLNSKVVKTSGLGTGAYLTYGYTEAGSWAGGTTKNLTLAEAEKKIVFKFTTSSSAASKSPALYLGWLHGRTDETLDIYMDGVALYDLTALGLENRAESELANMFNFTDGTTSGNLASSLLGGEGDFEADTNSDGLANSWSSYYNGTTSLDLSWNKFGSKSQRISGVTGNASYLGRSIPVKNSNTYLLVSDCKVVKTSGTGTSAYLAFGYTENGSWYAGVKHLTLADGAKRIVHKFTTSSQAVNSSPMIYLGWLHGRTDEVLDINYDGVALYDLTALGLENKSEDELARITNTNKLLGYDSISPNMGYVSVTSTENSVTIKGSATDNESGLSSVPYGFTIGNNSTVWKAPEIVAANSTVVNQQMETSGNGGRKLVRLSNGWLVAGVFDSTTGYVNFYVSEDDGRSWYRKCYVANNWRMWAMASYGTKVYILRGSEGVDWNIFNEVDMTTASGDMTSSAVAFESGQTSTGVGVSLAVDPSGNIYAAWSSKNSTYPNSFNIRYSKRATSGIWSSPIQVTTYNTAGIDATNPCIIINNDRPVVLYQLNTPNSNKGIYGSYFNGTSWNACNSGIAINGNSSEYGAYVQSSPSAAVDGKGFIHVVWHGANSAYSSTPNIYYSKSNDGGMTWSNVERLTNDGYDNQNASVTVDDNNRIHVVFQRRSAVSVASYDICKVTNYGSSWSPIQTITNSSSSEEHPSVCSNYSGFEEPLVIYKSAQGLVKYSGSIKEANFTQTNLIPGKFYTVKFEVRDNSGNIISITREIYTKAAIPALGAGNSTTATVDISTVDNNALATQYQIIRGKIPNFNTGSLPLIAGTYHSFIVMDDGKVKAWGYNTAGQLGFGDNMDRNLPAVIPGLVGVKQIAAGHNTSFALMNDGTVKAWGLNATGQLGLGDSKNRSVPTTIQGLKGVRQIVAGFQHTLALMENGTVKAWGYNTYGQLGLGDAVDRNIPTTIPGLTGVKQISAGAYHTIALMEDGTVKVWGCNTSGQLGLGHTENLSVPTDVPGLVGAKQIAAGFYHSMAIMSDGTVKAWGSNKAVGVVTSSNVNLPSTIPGLVGVKQLAGSCNYTIALMNDGTVKAWGENTHGQMGFGDKTARYIPTALPGISGVEQLAAGYFHTLMLMSDGTIKAAGYNGVGGLGLGDAVDRSTYTIVSALGATAIQYVSESGELVNTPMWISLTNKKVIIKGLSPNTAYALQAKARNGEGIETTVSTPVICTTRISDIPAAPVISDTSVVVANTSVAISWAAVSGATGYDIEVDGLVKYIGTKTAYTHTGLISKTTHTYRVRAKNTAGTSAWSPAKTVVTTFVAPNMVANISAQAEDRVITITWGKDPNAELYDIQFDGIYIENIRGNSITQSGLQPATQHTFSIKAKNAAGETGWNVPVSVSTFLLGTPQELRTVETDNSITLVWDSIPQATGYEIEINGTVAGSSTEARYVHSGLNPETSYRFRIRAKNDQGFSTWSEVLTASTLPVKPPMPSNLGATAAQNVITLTWNPVADVEGYDIELDGIVIYNDISTVYTHLDLESNTKHTYRVRSRNAAIEGDWSNTLIISTLPGKPKAPANIAVAASGSIVTIKWDKESGATGYDIEVDGVVVNNGTKTSYVHRRVSSDVGHKYRVRSRNAEGISEWSGLVVNNAIIAKCTKQNTVDLGLTAGNITDFSQYTLTVTYNPEIMDVVDLCALSAKNELTKGKIEGTDITIVEFAPGKITFVVDKVVTPGESWTGVINAIKFKAKVTGGTTITYTVIGKPENVE
ncbi:MAG: hypothetical protein N3B21_02065 [Clostridia bacterium]|nr:hypothetical protein [Clostridia bacterium]